MLIVAIMKSASSSFVQAMSDLTNYPVVDYNNENGEKLNATYHVNKNYEIPASVCVDFPVHLADKWDCKEEWAKLHIVPTKHNKKLIKERNIKCVILLRNPLEIYDSLRRVGYYRGFWRKWPRELIDERMTNFYNGWMEERNNPNHLFITFKDVIENTKETLERSLSFYGLDFTVPSDYILPKKRYNGNKE